MNMRVAVEGVQAYGLTLRSKYSQVSSFVPSLSAVPPQATILEEWNPTAKPFLGTMSECGKVSAGV